VPYDCQQRSIVTIYKGISPQRMAGLLAGSPDLTLAFFRAAFGSPATVASTSEILLLERV